MPYIRHEQRLSMDNDDMTQREACKEVNVLHLSMHLQSMRHLDEMTQQRNVKAKSLCQGRCSCLETCKDHDLLQFIFGHRDQGMAVSANYTTICSAEVQSCQCHLALQFVCSQGLVFCLGANELQHSPPGETTAAAEAIDYIINVAHPKVIDQPWRHQEFILNMDQTRSPSHTI